VFGGGFNVGVNVAASNLVYNDLNHFVRGLIELFYTADSAQVLADILRTIQKHGLAKNNKAAFVAFRAVYNAVPLAQRKLLDLYVLLQYGFQQQFRFNSHHDYNNTAGMSSFNSNTIVKLLGFCRTIKTRQVSFHSVDFEEILRTAYDDPIYYCDPPYLITLGSYNDGKRGFTGWTPTDEQRLYDRLDWLNKHGKKFLLSNVITHKGRTNQLLADWLAAHDYETKELYYKNRTEIMVKNY
jgi:adenine-specific DNA-methyltransferase